MRFLWKLHRFSKKNRTFAPKCQIHMNTEQVLGDTEQEEIYGITNKHRRTAEGEDWEWPLPCDDAHTSGFCLLATINPFLRQM